MDDPLALSLLIIEDEAMVLLLLRRTAESIGCTVMATASNAKDAMALIERHGREADAVLLDANLRGVQSEEVARCLRKMGLPFIVITGYNKKFVEEIADDAPILHKPFHRKALQDALQTLFPWTTRSD